MSNLDTTAKAEIKNYSFTELKLDFKPTIVVYHANCPDGFGAAYVCYKKFGNDARYIPADYSIPLDLDILEGEKVLMVDVAFPKPIMEQILNVTDRFFLIDHHISKMKEIGDMKHMYFDMDHSGAMLAWHCLFPKVEPLHMISLIEDRDLWRFKLPETKAYLAALDVLSMDFKEWDDYAQLLENDPETVLFTGKTLQRQFSNLVKIICKEAVSVNMDNLHGKMVNVPHIFASESGDHLYNQPDVDFSITWYENKNGMFHCSFRSLDAGPNHGIALKIASLWGGSGHSNAAGAKLDSIEFNKLCKSLGAYEHATKVHKKKTKGFSI